jgi:hypothetical protein
MGPAAALQLGFPLKGWVFGQFTDLGAYRFDLLLGRE